MTNWPTRDDEHTFTDDEHPGFQPAVPLDDDQDDTDQDADPGYDTDETHLDSLYRQLRTETRMALVPTTAAAASGGVDLWMNHAMSYAFNAGLVSHGLIDLAIAAGSNVALTFAAGLYLAGQDALTGLPGHRPLKRALRENETEPVPTMKPLLLGSAAAGVALAALGTTTGLGLLAYIGGFVIATTTWHVKQLKSRRAARRELRDAIRALPAAPDMLQLTAGTDTDLDLPGVDDLLPPSPRGELVTILDQWRIGVASKIIAGTELIRPKDHGDGLLEFIVDPGDDGVQLEALNAAKGRIHAALHLELPDADGHGGQTVEFDQPTGSVLDHSGQVRMQILSLSSATSTATRVGWDITTRPGNPFSVCIGVYVDDGSPVFWDLADMHGVWSGLVFASSGFGKSSLLEQLMLRSMQLGFCTMFIDPQGGASSPVAAANATWPILGKSRMYAGWQLMEELAAIREDWLSVHEGVGEITPGMIAPCARPGSTYDPDCPCGGITPPPVMCYIPECHHVFGANVPGSTVTKMGKRWGELDTRIRKLAMGIIVDSQLGDQPAFGGDEPLRSTLALRNYMAGYIPSATSANLVPGLPYSPARIPNKVGRGLFAGKASRNMGVTLNWLPRRSHAHLAGGVGPFSEDLFGMLPPRALHWADAEAAQRILPQVDLVKANRDAARERFRAKAAALRGDPPPAIEAPATPAAIEPAPVKDVPGGLAPTFDGEWPDAVLPSAEPPSAALLAAMASVAASTTLVVAQQSTVDTQTVEDVLWRLLMDDYRAGLPVSRKGDLIVRSGYSDTHVRNTLNKWLEATPPARTVANPKHGLWRPVLLEHVEAR